MEEVLKLSKQINLGIKQSKEYIRYLEAKKTLIANEQLSAGLREFRRKNYELQRRNSGNSFDETVELSKEFDELLHNSIVCEFIAAEQHICKMMQQMYISIAEGLEFDYLNE